MAKKDSVAKKVVDKNAHQEEKLKALESALHALDKQFGKGAVMKLGDAPPNAGMNVISTGCLELDMALGVGGLPKG